MPGHLIVWEDPAQPDAPAKVTVPAPKWVAETMAMGFTYEQALEILVIKDLPRRVWDARGANRPLFMIVPREAIPADRTFRDAWRLAL